ncbi:uncharacterized protein [Panulirus ornatus]|uniref:uncharacterized protein n=1 Tax=Panulirus ornatus TaxID=150431 RepID=UPI003A83820C
MAEAEGLSDERSLYLVLAADTGLLFKKQEFTRLLPTVAGHTNSRQMDLPQKWLDTKAVRTGSSFLESPTWLKDLRFNTETFDFGSSVLCNFSPNSIKPSSIQSENISPMVIVVLEGYALKGTNTRPSHLQSHLQEAPPITHRSPAAGAATVCASPSVNQHLHSVSSPPVCCNTSRKSQNILGVPINTDNDNDGNPSARLLPYASVTFFIILDALIDEYLKGRSYTDDQATIYRSLESKLSTTYGLEGRACLQRFICELQKFPIHDLTIVGELITAVFTPREDGRGLLQDYREAQLLGQLDDPGSCSTSYAYACPFSVFNYFKHLYELERQNDPERQDDQEWQDDRMQEDTERQDDLAQQDDVKRQNDLERQENQERQGDMEQQHDLDRQDGLERQKDMERQDGLERRNDLKQDDMERHDNLEQQEDLEQDDLEQHDNLEQQDDLERQDDLMVKRIWSRRIT